MAPVPGPRRAAAHRQSALCGWSMEATRPGGREIASLAEILPPGARVYLSAVPRRPRAEQRAAAKALARLGLVPVPHLAVRGFSSEAEAAEHVRTSVGEAGVRGFLVIGGDLDPPLGPFASARCFLERMDLARAGIEEIGIAAYPDGHPTVGTAVLEEEMHAKLRLARAAGLRPHLVTQFAFDVEPVLGWLRWLRATGEDVPVRIGIAGPADAATLARYAIRCGLVAAPLKGVLGKLDIALRMVRGGDPERLLDGLDAAVADGVADGVAGAAPGPVSAHFFSFGGIERTARWARGLALERCAEGG